MLSRHWPPGSSRHYTLFWHRHCLHTSPAPQRIWPHLEPPNSTASRSTACSEVGPRRRGRQKLISSSRETLPLARRCAPRLCGRTGFCCTSDRRSLHGSPRTPTIAQTLAAHTAIYGRRAACGTARIRSCLFSIARGSFRASSPKAASRGFTHARLRASTCYASPAHLPCFSPHFLLLLLLSATCAAFSSRLLVSSIGRRCMSATTPAPAPDFLCTGTRLVWIASQDETHQHSQRQPSSTRRSL